jgi:hypothetical protein
MIQDNLYPNFTSQDEPETPETPAEGGMEEAPAAPEAPEAPETPAEGGMEEENKEGGEVSETPEENSGF